MSDDVLGSGHWVKLNEIQMGATEMKTYKWTTNGSIRSDRSLGMNPNLGVLSIAVKINAN